MLHYPSSAEFARDITPPQIFGCPTEGIVVTVDPGEDFATVFWDDITATDDSGETPQFANSHSPGDRFFAGITYLVSYTFWDSAFNFEQCDFTVTVTSKQIFL